MRWPASDVPRAQLGVETWEVAPAPGGAAGYDLYGLGEAPDPSSRNVRVHAGIGASGDGRIHIDVDLPRVWHMTFAPGEAATMDGDVPSDVALALGKSALDAPRAVQGASVTIQTNAAILTPKPDCLILRNANLIIDGSEHGPAMAAAAQSVNATMRCADPNEGTPCLTTSPDGCGGSSADLEDLVQAASGGGCFDACTTAHTRGYCEGECTPGDGCYGACSARGHPFGFCQGDCGKGEGCFASCIASHSFYYCKGECT
jgi:hypothetical protein